MPRSPLEDLVLIKEQGYTILRASHLWKDTIIGHADTTTGFSSLPVHGERWIHTLSSLTILINHVEAQVRLMVVTRHFIGVLSFFFFSVLFKLFCMSVYTELWVDMHEFQKSRCPAQEIWKNKTDTVTLLSRPQHWETNHPCRETHKEMLLTLLIYFTD